MNKDTTSLIMILIRGLKFTVSLLEKFKKGESGNKNKNKNKNDQT